MIAFGAQNKYQWLVTDQDCDVLGLCPEVVLGKYVAITSIDSGSPTSTDKELAAGWQCRHGITYSPKIQAIEEVPREGWDEWYIFAHPIDLGTSHLQENIFEVPQGRGHVSVFVNYGFALQPAERSKGLADLFWQQIEWIQPESYVADNDYLTFVTSNNILFSHVPKSIKGLSSQLG